MKPFQIIVILILFLFTACSNEEDEIQINHFIIQKKFYFNSFIDSVALAVDTYYYKSDDILETICHDTSDFQGNFHSSGYSKFRYTNDGQLSYKTTYTTKLDYIGFLILDSTSYHYDNKRLIREECYYLNHEDSTISISYEYDGPLLKRKYEYNKGILKKWTSFLYTDNLCTKEFVYSDSTTSKEISYTLHLYQDDMLIRSEVFSINYYTILSQIFSYFYDSNANLVTEESVDIFKTGPFDYVYRYEYAKVPE
ncbi:MAG: hypothetical protein U0T82_02655 [Bacteroidales bacterium]